MESNTILAVYEEENALMRQHEDISTRAACLNANGKPFELFELENRLRDGLKSCKIKDITHLSERMKRTEMRIQEYVDETRNKEAEKEKEYLNELKRLQVLHEDIVLQSIEYLSKNIDRLEINELETRLRYGFEKCKIQDTIQIEERIKRIEKRIEMYQNEDRRDAVEQEMKYLHDLQLVQIIISEIFRRKSIGLVSNNEEKSGRIELNNLLHQLTEIPECAEKTVMELLEYFYRRLLNDNTNETMSNSIRSKLTKVQSQLQGEDLLSEQIDMKLQEINRTIDNQDCSVILYSLNKILKLIRPLNLQEIQRYIKRSELTANLIRDKDIILLIGTTGSGKSTTVQFLTDTKMKETRVEICPGKFLKHITTDGPITNPGLIDIKSNPLSKSETRFIIPVTISLKDIFGSYETNEIILCDAPGFSDTESPEMDISNCARVTRALKCCKSVSILALSSYRSLGDRGEGIQQLIHILINMIYGIENRLNSILYGFTKYPSEIDIHAILSDIKTSRIDSDPLLRSNTTFITILNDMIEKTRSDPIKIDPIHGDIKIIMEQLKNLRGIHYPDEVFQFSINQQTQIIISNQVNRYRSSIIYALKHKNVSLLFYYSNQFRIFSDIIGQQLTKDQHKDSLRLINDNIQEYSYKIMEELNDRLKNHHQLKNEDIQEYETAYKYIKEIQQHFQLDDLFIENLRIQLENLGSTLGLFHPSIGIYLTNLHLIQNYFQEFQGFYIKYCDDLCVKFEYDFGQSIEEMVLNKEFQQLNEILDKIFQLIPMLNDHLNKKIEKKYFEIIQIILKHFDEKISNGSKSILLKINLTENDIKSIENEFVLLKLAKEAKLFEKHIKNFNEIYDELIENLIKYVNEIILRIEEFLNKNSYYYFDSIEQLIYQFELIRTLPDMELKTNRSFYRIIELIHFSIRKLRNDIQEIIYQLDFQSNTINIRPLLHLLSHLKKTQWVDRISPGFFDKIRRDIENEFIEQMENFELKLKKFNLDLEYPENIPLANEILIKIHLFEGFERYLPELRVYQQQKSLDYLKNELNQLKQIEISYDNLYPPIYFLKQTGYLNINKLNEEIQLEKKQLDFQIKELQLIIQQYEQSILSNVSRNLFGRVLNKLMIGSESNDFLKEKGYSDINIVKNKLEIYQNNLDKINQISHANQTNFNEHSINLQTIKDEYFRLVDKHESMVLQSIQFLNEHGFENYEVLQKKIEEKTNDLNYYIEQKQQFYFPDEFDGLFMNQILTYVNHCENLISNDIKQLANEINECLKKYLIEYGNFLEKEIERHFNSTINLDKIHSKDLKKYSYELILMEENSLVFKYLNGRKKLDYCKKKFLHYYDLMLIEIEQDKINENYEDFQRKLDIIQSLICLDEFFIKLLENNKFSNLFKKSQFDFYKIPEQTHKTILDAISKQDFILINSKLSSIEIFSKSKFIILIKTSLEIFLQSIIKDTKMYANSLNENLRYEQNTQNVRRLIENLEKIQNIFQQTKILNFIDKNIRISLENLFDEIEKILMKKILNILQSIGNFFNENNYLFIEKTMEYLIDLLKELDDYYKFESIQEKINQMKTRISQLSHEILRKYDFIDLNKYINDSPKDVCEQLKLVSSNGYSKYIPIHRQVIEKLRKKFSSEINQVKNKRGSNRSMKLTTIRDASYYLPDELKNIFQNDIKEINEMIRKEAYVPDFD
ncbi:unnamed protein product [Adineta steineri]|uniref:Uncharacterized protein n=1 Tax=Adineta steineri TaxID=433720 RepID=A0A813V3M8_9BILA|nr:unnamed protein product [Adineta steineri]